MLDVVCWKWKSSKPYRSTFGPETVNVLRRMVARNLRLPHRFTCITDDATGIDQDIRIIPLWDTYANVPNPSSTTNPSCYRRLRMFSEEARELIGDRIVSIDLDVVIVDDITPLFDRDEDFVIWGGQSVQPRGRLYNWYNGSLMMLRAGSRRQVWDTFDPRRSPHEANRAGHKGSDQGWITHCLGKGEATWSVDHGVYSFRNHVLPSGGRLPSNAKIVVFHGRFDPWSKEIKAAYPWVREHYH